MDGKGREEKSRGDRTASLLQDTFMNIHVLVECKALLASGRVRTQN